MASKTMSKHRLLILAVQGATLADIENLAVNVRAVGMWMCVKHICGAYMCVCGWVDVCVY